MTLNLHATRLEQIGGIDVIAIVDPDTKLAESVLKTRLSSKKHGHHYANCKLLSHFKDLIALKPDAVFIGIPPVYRGSLADNHDIELQFVKAGIHVFVEKPLSVVPPEKFEPYVEAIRKASEEKNVIVSVGSDIFSIQFDYKDKKKHSPSPFQR
jgi:predicted dehydrogenase